MKKWLKTLLIVAVAMVFGFQLGIVAILHALGAGGAGDWSCDELPDPYEIWRLNADDINLCQRDGPGSAKPVVGSYVWKVAWNEELILAAQKPQRGSAEEKSVYYALDVSSGELNGPFSEEELDAFCAASQYEDPFPDWKTLDQLKKTR